MGHFLLPYILVNLGVYVLYGYDKYKAIRREWRVPETILLFGAVIGVFGALTGMYLCRHKTRKPKFFITVPLIAVAEVIVFFVISTGIAR
ncbi:MAG: DUF1294 domain-containing protein [Lachnospiraceae bacterium]|nr:DUF1294 domain-containing protein [Lachnospiraceae bacterium]